MKKETRSTLFGIEEIITEEESKGGFDIWKFVNSISDNKNYLFDDNTKKYYNSWTVNKHFSAFLDTFLHVEFLNSNFHSEKLIPSMFDFKIFLRYGRSNSRKGRNFLSPERSIQIPLKDGKAGS